MGEGSRVERAHIKTDQSEEHAGRGDGGTAETTAAQGPDYAGILAALEKAATLAHEDKRVLAVIGHAREGIMTLHAAAGAKAAA